MFRTILGVLALAQMAVAQDAAATIKAAEYALGMIRGAQRIDAINTLEFWASGTGAEGAKIAYHASFSYRTPAMRVDMTSVNRQRQIHVVNGHFGWDESVPGAGFIAGTAAVPTPTEVNQRLLQMWSTPHGVLKAAERALASVIVSQENGATTITFPMEGGATAKIVFNAKNQPEQVATRAGNVVTETTYTDYKDLGEIQSDVLFPSHILQKRNGQTVLDLAVSKTDPNNPYLVFPVPDKVADKGTKQP
jgi:hypothetical protein